METVLKNNTYPFLQGGGEMGALTRQFDWSKTPLGSPDQWPQSLRTTVSNLLRSKFPMFLWWGPDMIQFYNDAYRPSMGNEGKHPVALGQKGEECWPEIWNIISPLHRQVQTTGEATWMEDQLVPIYRNGKIEDVYWTFSYSSVLDDEGKHYGILVTCMETTKAVKGHQQIEESQQQLLALFEESPVAIATISADEDLLFLSANILYGDLVARKPQDIICKPLLEALPEIKDQGFDQLLKEVIATGIPFTANEVPVHIFRDGRLQKVYVNLTYQPRKTNGGKVTGILVVASDVTHQVEARHKIEESELKYRSLFESMNQGFCVLEMLFDQNDRPFDYRFLEINPVFENQTGLKNAIGKTALELVPNLEPHWFELYGKVALTGEPARFEEGSEAMGRWFDVYAFRFGDNNSRKVALLFSDITDRKKAVELIRKSEQGLRDIILQAPVAMCILRGDKFLIEVANKKMFEFWNIDPEGKLNMPLFDAIPEAENEGYEELMMKVLKTGEPFVGKELTVTLPRNGAVETVYINFSYEALRELDGSIWGMIATVHEVTEQVLARKKIEELVEQRTKELSLANEALQKSNQELQRSNANLEEFAHAASHDLKEPVRKIHFFTQQLKEQLTAGLKEQELRSFNRIENATRRMGNLIDDLLLYSHVSHRPHQMEPVNLGQMVERVLEDLELDIQEKAAVIHLDKLPIVQGHSRQLQQLFQNLISNALKYSKAGLPPTIDITSGHTVENGKAYLWIEVKDNGIGFEQQYADKIFQMFTRLHGRSEYSGTGVGLSIVKKVVENHNAIITAESSPGEGSSFRVFLPEQ